MRRRPTIRVITFLSAALIVAGVLAFTGLRKAQSLELYARANTEHAFDELVTSISELSNALEKSLYISDPALESALCTQIFGRAMTAQMAMGVLPYSSQELEQTASFIAKVGDYACVLARTVGSNGGYSDEELENLGRLSETASVMALNLRDMQARIMAGALTMDEVYGASSRVENGAEQAPLAGTAFESIEQEFPELPALIYDGPFSESLSNPKPLYLEGREQVGQEEALKAAAAFLGAEEKYVEAQGEYGGDVPCWVCSAYMNGGEYTVYVTKQGGEICSAVCSRIAGEPNYTVKQGLELVRDLVDGWDLEDLQESYHVVEDDVLLVNFEHTEDGVICYPDLIKVSVALDTGTLMGYDAQGYISAHTERDIPEATVSREDAQASIARTLDVTGHNMAIIPSDGGEERFCHEFVCQTEAGERYILYVNAQTGEEEKILILLEDESGTLTI